MIISALSLLASCGEEPATAPATPAAAPTQEGCAPPVTTDTGLIIEDIECGTGAEAQTGQQVTVHYVGTLEDGTEFDSSRQRAQPFPFTLGAGEVIAGWDEGVDGMKVGGIRKLTIPPDLGYGPGGYPPVIPPNATLIFEIELLKVKDAPNQ